MGPITKHPVDSDSPDLHIVSQPTREECTQIWSATAASWKDSLTVPIYLVEAQYLTTVPLARDGGMTTWVLVDDDDDDKDEKKLPPGDGQQRRRRRVFCSCESFRKRALASDERGHVEEGLVHGIASVFCPPAYRGRGYGTRHMRELAEVLRGGWQSEYGQSLGSVLYSDIGKECYARLGWRPNPGNGHFVFSPVKMEKKKKKRAQAQVQLVHESGLEALCRRDEIMVRKAMATPSTRRKRVVILPDLDHMLWHIRKEDFATNHIFGEKAEAKGAIVGRPGKQVWAVWVRRYYEHPYHPDKGEEKGGNVLYILRLVVEGDNTANKPHESQSPPPTDAYLEQAVALQAVLQAAQAEAAEWCLDHVKLWEPSPLVRNLLSQGSLDTTWVERQETSIASALWFTDDGDAVAEAPAWVNNEY